LLGIDRSRVNNIRVDWVVYIHQAISAAAWLFHAANHGNACLHTHLFLSNGCVVSWLGPADFNVRVFIGRVPLFLSQTSCREATSLESKPHGTPEFLDFSRALKGPLRHAFLIRCASHFGSGFRAAMTCAVVIAGISGRWRALGQGTIAHHVGYFSRKRSCGLL
jgi:hypothetical protein